MAGKEESARIELQETLRLRALDLIGITSTMTLATSGGEGVWAAPVYFVYFSGRFYFFSKPDSRHVEDALAAGTAAAAIHATVESWQDIRGLQMSGLIRQAGFGLNSLGAVRAYLSKFPFTGEFFNTGEEVTLESFVTRFKVKLYYFKPVRICYQDNRIRFGFREEIILDNA